MASKVEAMLRVLLEHVTERQVPEEELDALLESKLVFLVDATGIPVLLSLLVLIFTSGGEDLTKLPSNRIELYELGIESAINKRLQRGQPQKGDSGPQIYDQLVRHWMRLFNHPLPTPLPTTPLPSSPLPTIPCRCATGCGSSTSTARA